MEVFKKIILQPIIIYECYSSLVEIEMCTHIFVVLKCPIIERLKILVVKGCNIT